MSAHSLSNEVGMGSRSQDLEGAVLRIFTSSSSDIGVKEEKVLRIGLELATNAGAAA